MSGNKLKNNFPSPTPAQQEADEFVAAVKDGNQDAVTAFLGKHASAVDHENSDGCTAMIMAIAVEQNATVELLLAKGAQIGWWDICHSPLTYAAQIGRTAILALLLEKGAQIGAAS